ncbi:hypothetical protein PHSY_002207 [Pseudozyma hubeiensis SY62]|uniref:Uncharacterized protein n=1 Tax=Pseudozyma hubeiensis (strain SY62) TaxID=1305764 RepID=R9P0K0_PSEHS|nr:hypothetical protein PHSY_002207 [Pseudozyma hubeiensis SY62]GAC94634.1 hypothetical protein PHSY_002207 [Pseudozyma hubeiensis SY62]
MPWLSASNADALGGEPSRVASQVVQLLRGPSQPSDFPASIVFGLSSTNATAQRAAIAELRSYIHRLFFLDLKPYFFISSVASAGIIALLIVIGFPVVLHRLFHGRLYPFRLERRAQGSYLVPNAINCFLLLEGVYGILTVAYNFVVWQLFSNHHQSYMNIWQASRSLIWIPLYMGAFLTGWGSFYTAPGALDKPTAAASRLSGRGRMPWPVIVNLACWGVPVALIVSLLPPVCLSSVKMVDTYHAYQDWDRRLEALLNRTAVGSLVDQAMVNDYRSQAYAIFTGWTRSYYYVDIAYLLWGVWAILFLVFYVPAGGVLVFLLYRQVTRQKVILLSYQRKLEEQLAHEERQTHVTVLSGEHARLGRPQNGWTPPNATSRIGAPLEDIYEDHGASDDSRGTGRSGGKNGHDAIGLESALRQEPPASHQVHGARTPGAGQVTSLAEEAEATAPAVIPVPPRRPSTFRKLMKLETGTSTRSTKRKRISITGGPMSRYRYLRRCLVNLLILYFGIISAACFFGAITIFLAAVEYEHALKGPDEITKPIGIAQATVAWVSAVFGFLTIGSIIFRNFDNPEPEASQNSGEGGGIRRRFVRNTSKTQGSASGGAGEQGAVAVEHEKTRTLPAVPESVDLEASMMSGVQSRPNMAMNTAMKFSMAEQTSRPGGFVIRPDDQLASMMSAEETSRSGHFESVGRMADKSRVGVLRAPPATRAWIGREREATMSIPQDVTESFGVGSLPMIAVGSHQSGERFETGDTTLKEYPSFDPHVLKAQPEAGAKEEEEAAPRSPVLKRSSKRADSVGMETPAKRIAREWAQTQYMAQPLPQTPQTPPTAVEQAELARTADGTPRRPARDARRAFGSPTSDNSELWG